MKISRHVAVVAFSVGLLISCKSKENKAEPPPAVAAPLEPTHPPEPAPTKEPAAALVALTEVALPELHVALDFEANPTIADVYANDKSFSVRGKDMIEVTISDNEWMKSTLAKVEERATHMPDGDVLRKEDTKAAWTYIRKSKDKYPQWFLSTKRTLGHKGYTCEATLHEEAQLAVALAACESLRPAKK